jgi:RHS repeat-associated protein
VTIDYVYDGLHRLTEANYSNGDYYHYTHDAVGNRETQSKSVLGFVTNDTYVYDDANRLASVNGVSYTWDNNGNLLSDGVNTYTYDSANRLKAISNQQSAISYSYNGLNDRLQEIVNGSTTTFTMDLNASLTQALSDGTDAYIYGVGRIAQVNTDTDYFLGDALGSVRQMTNSSGAITYARMYDPYGVVTAGAGSSQSAYGYTNEYTSQGLVYLRARHYIPQSGRFTTKDLWPGDYNQPMSYNTWLYVYANPINLTDASGRAPGPGSQSSQDCVSTFPLNRINVDYADRNVKLDKSYWLNTYTAAGIAVQCWADLLPVKPWEDGGHRSGTGDAQISDRHAETAYGQTIVGNGFGVRCYIPIGQHKTRPCPICILPWEIKRINSEHNGDYFGSLYELEGVHDQTDTHWATTYMQRRIKAVVDSYRGNCTPTDLFIAAALAQGAAISPSEMYNNISNSSKLDPNAPIYVISPDRRGVTIDWIKYFTDWGDAHATAMEVDRFATAVEGLGRLGWGFPTDLNWSYISAVRYWAPPFRRPR